MRTIKLSQIQCMGGSLMKCKVCGGWGGEYGHAKNGIPMCADCWKKKYG